MNVISSEAAQDRPNSVIKSAVSFFSGTFLSRITGFLRDISMAFCFGTDPAIAAFLVALRFANLMRRIFGEGALLTGFVPHFESHRHADAGVAGRFFRDVFFSLAVLLIVLIGLGEAGLYAGLRFGGFSADNRQILYLTMLMLPGLLFVCLYGLCSGLLQCQKSFFIPGFAPVGFNVAWIAAVWWCRDDPPVQAAVGLSVAIVVAFLLQWLITLPGSVLFLVRTLPWRECLRFQLFSSSFRAMLSSISLGVVGVGATQINSALDSVFARYAALEGPAYLTYAIHLQQLPLALVGIALSTALLPPLSRAISQKNMVQYCELIRFSLTNALYLLMPCTAAILVLGPASVNLIYGHGDFSQEATIQTTLCLWGYGVGLIPMSLAILLTPAFYAQKDYQMPMICSLLSIALNIVLNVIFVFYFDWKSASLALSTSAAAAFNAGLLFYSLKKKYQVSLMRSLLTSSWRFFGCTVGAAFVVSWLGVSFWQDPLLSSLFQGTNFSFPRDFQTQFSHFFFLSLSFTGSFLIFGRLFKAHPFFAFRGFRQKTSVSP